MASTHYLIYECSKIQAGIIYENTLVDHLDYAIRVWDLTVECMRQYPSMFYHTNTIEIRTKQAQLSLQLENFAAVNDYLDEAQAILDFIDVPITNYILRIRAIRDLADETIKLTDGKNENNQKQAERN